MLVAEEKVDQLYEAVEALYKEAGEKEMITPDVISAYSNYCAARGKMDECVKCVLEHKSLLFSTLPSFVKTLVLLVAVANRSPFILTDVEGVSDVTRWREMCGVTK